MESNPKCPFFHFKRISDSCSLKCSTVSVHINLRVRALLIYNRQSHSHPLSLFVLDKTAEDKKWVVQGKALEWILIFRLWYVSSRCHPVMFKTEKPLWVNMNFFSDKTCIAYQLVILYPVSQIKKYHKKCQSHYNCSIWLQGKLFCIFH